MMRKISNSFPVEFVNGMTIALHNIIKQGNISAQCAMFVLTNIKWGGVNTKGNIESVEIEFYQGIDISEIFSHQSSQAIFIITKLNY